MLEFANNIPGKASFHVGASNLCTLDQRAVDVCPALGTFDDLNQGDGVLHSDVWGECYTDYNAADLPMELGCAPMKNGMQLTGDNWNDMLPGVVAAEVTGRYAKVFFIPDAELHEAAGLLPASDGAAARPQPNQWDRWVISYYPFAASEELSPGTCPDPENVMLSQHFVLNIGLCGDWAGDNFVCPEGAQGTQHPFYETQAAEEAAAAITARGQDGACFTELMGRYKTNTGGDCCTNFIYDQPVKETISGTGHVCQESACPWNCTGTWGTASWQCPQYDDDGCIMFQVCASSSAS